MTVVALRKVVAMFLRRVGSTGPLTRCLVNGRIVASLLFCWLKWMFS